MIWTPLFLLSLPLAIARPHLPDSIAHAHRRQARAQLIERAGAAYDNETKAEISAWEHDHNSATVVSSAVQSAVSSAAVDSASGIQAVGTALTAVNSPSPSVTSDAVPTSSDESAAAQPTADAAASSEETTDAASSAVPQAAIASPSPSPAEESSATPSPSASSVTRTTVVTASRSSTVVRVTASSSASAAASNSDSGNDKIAGINKTTFIIIIVVAAVVALAGVGWTVFRRWKLKPSRKFDDKMRPINFSPHQDFLEKTHHRSSSNSSAAMQRDEFVAELDNKHVAGIPDHDFTAGSGMAGQGIYQDYNSDPYAHAEAYEYDPTYPYDQPGYDQPTQDTGAGAGYAELQRGNSIGSGSGHGHGQQYAVEQFTMPMPDQYLGRPTGGSDGPYSQAAVHRY